jgi:hypothetical protein
MEPVTSTTLPISTHELSRVSFDYAVSFFTDGGGELRIETPFTLSGRGREELVDPAAVGGHAVDLLALLHLRIDSAEAAESGSLVLRLGDAVVTVEPHDQFEAWTFADRVGAKAVCSPGGGVTTWGFASS